MEILIRGVAERTSSAVDSLVEQMRTTGASDATIINRLRAEVEAGPLLAEMRRFATAQVPGFIGDMSFRFARDSLSDLKSKIRAELEADRKAQASRGLDAGPEELLPRIPDNASEIDTIAWEESDLNPPPGAPLDTLYQWVTVHDSRVCDVCAENHGEVNTLEEWASIGEPRSGACLGGENCRCVLVPADALTDEQQTTIRDMGPIILERK
jgi:hypothetical protein